MCFFGNHCVFINISVFFIENVQNIKQKIQKNPPSRQPVQTRDGRRTGRARAGARADLFEKLFGIFRSISFGKNQKYF